MIDTTTELFTKLRPIILAATGVPECINSNPNAPSPNGDYCSVLIRDGIVKRGQANDHSKNSETPDSIDEDKRSQLVAECRIDFWRGDATLYASKLAQANKLSSISALLFGAGIGWQRVGPIQKLTDLQGPEYEARAQVSLYVLYEQEITATINTINLVPYSIEDEDGVEIVSNISGIEPLPATYPNFVPVVDPVTGLLADSSTQLFAKLRPIILAATGVPECIKSDPNAPAPNGEYCSVSIRSGIVERGQANDHSKNSETPGSIDEDKRSQLVAECRIDFYRGDVLRASRMAEANKLSSISEMLFHAGIGWQKTGDIRTITELQGATYEQRSQLSLFVLYEQDITETINAIEQVPVAVEDEDGIEIISDIIAIPSDPKLAPILDISFRIDDLPETHDMSQYLIEEGTGTGLTYSLTGNPAQVTIDGGTGLMSIAGGITIDTHAMTLTVTTSEGSDSELFDLVIAPAIVVVNFTVHPQPLVLEAGVNFTVHPQPLELAAGVNFTVHPQPLELVAGVNFTVHPQALALDAGVNFTVHPEPLALEAGVNFTVHPQPLTLEHLPIEVNFTVHPQPLALEHTPVVVNFTVHPQPLALEEASVFVNFTVHPQPLTLDHLPIEVNFTVHPQPLALDAGVNFTVHPQPLSLEAGVNFTTHPQPLTLEHLPIEVNFTVHPQALALEEPSVVVNFTTHPQPLTLEHLPIEVAFTVHPQALELEHLPIVVDFITHPVPLELEHLPIVVNFTVHPEPLSLTAPISFTVHPQALALTAPISFTVHPQALALEAGVNFTVHPQALALEAGVNFTVHPQPLSLTAPISFTVHPQALTLEAGVNFTVHPQALALEALTPPVWSAISPITIGLDDEPDTSNDLSVFLTPGTGTGLVYSLTSEPAGMTINASTGVLTINTGVASVYSPSVVATTSGGSDTEAFSVTVEESVSLPEWAPQGNATNSYIKRTADIQSSTSMDYEFTGYIDAVGAQSTPFIGLGQSSNQNHSTLGKGAQADQANWRDTVSGTSTELSVTSPTMPIPSYVITRIEALAGGTSTLHYAGSTDTGTPTNPARSIFVIGSRAAASFPNHSLNGQIHRVKYLDLIDGANSIDANFIIESTPEPTETGMYDDLHGGVKVGDLFNFGGAGAYSPVLRSGAPSQLEYDPNKFEMYNGTTDTGDFVTAVNTIGSELSALGSPVHPGSWAGQASARFDVGDIVVAKNGAVIQITSIPDDDTLAYNILRGDDAAVTVGFSFPRVVRVLKDDGGIDGTSEYWHYNTGVIGRWVA